MAMGKRETERQDEVVDAHGHLPEPPGHPFYRRLSQLLAENGFDGSKVCAASSITNRWVGRAFRQGGASGCC